MLYAQAVGDLHLGAPDGPVIGRVHRGAHLWVVPAASGHVAVTLPDFRAGLGTTPAPLIAYAAASIFVAEPADVLDVGLAGRVVEDFPPGAGLWAQKNAPAPFAVTLCGDIHVVAEEAGWTRIAQYHLGVELLGWYDNPITATRGPIRCKLRQVFRDGQGLVLNPGSTESGRTRLRSVPEGFVALSPSNSEDALAAHLRSGGPLYWLIRTADGAACEGWRFIRARENLGSRSVLEGRLESVRLHEIDGVNTSVAFDATYESRASGRPGEFTTQGPHFAVRGASAGGDRCSATYGFAGSANDTLRLVPGGVRDPALVAWHPDDEEHWFKSAKACAAAVARAATGSGARMSGGYHVDCYPEIHRQERP